MCQKLSSDNDVYVEFHCDYCIVKDQRSGNVLLEDGLYLLAEGGEGQAEKMKV